MAGRSRSTFGKRLKEMKRQEKRQDKAARRDQRKAEKLRGVPSDSLGEAAAGETFPDAARAGEDTPDENP